MEFPNLINTYKSVRLQASRVAWSSARYDRLGDHPEFRRIGEHWLAEMLEAVAMRTTNALYNQVVVQRPLRRTTWNHIDQ
jgi:hypothetical protein